MSKKRTAGLAPLRPGWTRVPDEKIPRPTFWPAALALGTVLMFWGSVTSWIVAAVGLILLAVSVAGWLGEMRHE
jgi:sensor domain CHASE-containing protein